MDPDEKTEKSPGETEANPRQNPGETQGERLEEWRVRKSPAIVGMGELYIRDRTGKDIHVILDPLTAYDLSDKLLVLAAELKNRDT